jgi:hypothetical protein
MTGRIPKLHFFNGVTLTAKGWASRLGINENAFRQRLQDLNDPVRIFAPGFFRKPKGKTQRHGHSHSRSYHSWQDMHKRCYNQKSDKWLRYGARGIKVCARWKLFANFLADMGERPHGKTLDRKNNNGNYTPSNCRWATPKQQVRNSTTVKTVMVNGKKFESLTDAAIFFNVKPNTFRVRLNRGFSPENSIKKHHLRWGHELD